MTQVKGDYSEYAYLGTVSHNGGLVSGSEERMTNAASQLESVVLKEGNYFNDFQKQISLENDFIDNLTQVLKSFWSKLEAEYLDILYII